MPFSPSDFAWWVWLLCGVVAAVVCWFFVLLTTTYADTNKSGTAIAFGLVAFVFGLAGAGCFLIALVRFVKWVWDS